jgi:hypothetical protein
LFLVVVGLIGMLMREVGLAKYVGSNRYLLQWVVARKGRRPTCLVYCNTLLSDCCGYIVENLTHR